VSTEFDEMGPVDYLVVEYPAGTQMTGEGLRMLGDLVDRKIIRILDLQFIRKMADGSIMHLEVSRPASSDEPDLSMFDGASSGILDEGDLEEAAGAIEPGSAAGLIVYENRWAAPLATTLRRQGAQMVAGGRIPIQAILAALDASEPASLES
jgi:Family of unknown function (DUF6325)